MRALERRVVSNDGPEFFTDKGRGSIRAIHVLPRAKRRRTRLYSYVVASVFTLIGTTAVVGIAGAPATGANFWGSERRAIAVATETLLQGIAANDLESALAVFPEGAARSLIEAEERRVFGSPLTLELDSQDRIDELRALRADLRSQGVRWDDVQLTAFGGTRARVSDGVSMAQPITALTGEVYFQSGGRLYAIELSAWRCDGRYVVMDIWQAREVSTALSGLKSESLARSEAVRLGAIEPGLSTRIEFPRPLYYEYGAR